jgi:hypothetical protein
MGIIIIIIIIIIINDNFNFFMEWLFIDIIQTALFCILFVSFLCPTYSC